MTNVHKILGKNKLLNITFPFPTDRLGVLFTNTIEVPIIHGGGGGGVWEALLHF